MFQTVVFQYVSLLIFLYYPASLQSQCYLGEEAAWELRTWVLDEGAKEDVGEVQYYETVLSLVRTDEGAWYLVGGGWQGAFYYEEDGRVEGSRGRVGAYLYPDFTTAVVGLWEDHILIRGRASSLAQACKVEAGGWSLRFVEVSGPPLEYSPPSHYSLGAPPTLKDPYEAVTVEVQPSLIPKAAYGLFLARSVIAGEIVAFYSGFVINCESSLRALDRRELSDQAEHDRNMYNIALDLGQEENLCIDIPTHMGNDVSLYNATLGHKVNHSFEPNSEFVLFSAHPVLGTVMALAALEDLDQGIELTVNYGYNYTAEPDQPEWFVEQWKQYYSTQECSGHIHGPGCPIHQEL